MLARAQTRRVPRPQVPVSPLPEALQPLLQQAQAQAQEQAQQAQQPRIATAPAMPPAAGVPEGRRGYPIGRRSRDHAPE